MLNKDFLTQLEKKDIFRILFESAGEGLVLVDKQGIILLVNPRMVELFQYTEFELMGMSVDDLIPDHLRNKHTLHREKYNEQPVKRSMGQGQDLSAKRKNGTSFPVEVSLNYFKAEEEILIMGLITDITERKQAERELQKLNIELEDRVIQRTRELADAIRELEYTNKILEKTEGEVRSALEKEKILGELKSRFVSTASHEFRTPLATILSSVSLIGKYDSEMDKEKRQKHIERIKSSVNNLKDILNDFLSLQKLEEGRTSKLSESINLFDFIENIIEELMPICKPGQKIVFDNYSDVIIESDPLILKNVLSNIFSNAIKFSPENGIIKIHLFEEDSFLKVDISDQGIGISDEDQEHIFERFFRGKNSVNIQGTGLGLNIVKKYMEILGGGIEFKSKLNTGTVFTIKIPNKTSFNEAKENIGH